MWSFKGTQNKAVKIPCTCEEELKKSKKKVRIENRLVSNHKRLGKSVGFSSLYSQVSRQVH